MMGVIMRILILSFFLLGGSHSQSIEQTSAPQFLREGESLSLKCKYKVSSSPYLFWYVQYPGKCPEVLLHHLLQKESNGFSAKHDPGTTSYNMRRDGVSLSDSGVYLCAVSDAVNFGVKTVFGRGTILRVLTKTERTEPSVYKLRAKNGDSDSVCLITDIPNPNTTVSMQDEDKTIDLNNISVLDSSSSNIWRYSAVVLENPSCNLQYDSKEITAKTDTDDDPETCTSMSLGEHFKTNPSLNSVSLTVFGLRILTAKAIIFNLILTVRLWSS